MGGNRVVVAAAIVRDGCLLVQQRGFPPELAGLWELPGGGVEPGESERDAVVRECREELGAGVVVLQDLGVDVTVREGLTLRTYVSSLTVDSVEPVPKEHTALRWCRADELDGVDWLPADRVLVPALRAVLRRPWPA